MGNFTTADIIAIIGAFFAGISGVIAAINAGKANAKATKAVQQNTEQFQKLSEIHAEQQKTHDDINGRVAETVALKVKEGVKEQVDAAVALAVAKVLSDKGGK